jgi:hypothetical protein
MSLGSIVIKELTKKYKGDQLQTELCNYVHNRRDFAAGLRGKVPFDAKIEGHVFTYCPTTKTVIGR